VARSAGNGDVALARLGRAERVDPDAARVVPDGPRYAEALRQLVCPGPKSNPLDRPPDVDMQALARHGTKLGAGGTWGYVREHGRV